MLRGAAVVYLIIFGLYYLLLKLMASGFITLTNGKNWSARWSRYDFVLETIMNRLRCAGVEGDLKLWLQYILPNEDKGDVESGYCFYKKMETGAADFETVVRCINTNLMRDCYYRIFWNVVAKLDEELDSNDDGVGFLIHQLYASFLDSLVVGNLCVLPEIDSSDYDIFTIGSFTISKEWGL